MGYDDVILKMGEFGRYQRRIYFVLCLPAISCAFHKMGGVFLSAKTDFRCLLPDENPENATFPISSEIASINFPWDNKENNWSRCERYDFGITDLQNVSYTNISLTTPTVKCDSFVYDKSQYILTATTEVGKFNFQVENAWNELV